MHGLNKDPVEGTDGGKAGGKGNIRDAGALFQKAAGVLDAQAVDKVGKAEIHSFLENMGNIIFVTGIHAIEKETTVAKTE